MNEHQYITFLGVLIVPALVAQIVKLTRALKEEATRCLYQSEFYEKLSNEELKLWHN